MDDKKKILPSIGRLGRRDYVLWQLLLSIVVIAFFVLKYITADFLGFLTLRWMQVLMFGFILFEIYLTAKRLQDCNISGWFSLLFFFRACIIPGILFMCMYPGTKGANKFGADPFENDSASNPTKKDFPEASH